jgi:hypothetical protein
MAAPDHYANSEKNALLQSKELPQQVRGRMMPKVPEVVAVSNPGSLNEALLFGSYAHSRLPRLLEVLMASRSRWVREGRTSQSSEFY